jgi:hypothetical protein
MTSESDPDALFAMLRAADPDVMDRDELALLTQRIAAHVAWCQALQVRVTRRQRQLANEGRAEAPRDLLSREGRQSGKEARTADERERVCTALPSFEDALSNGSVTAGHVDAIAGAIRNLDDQVTAEFLALGVELLADAERFGVDAFDRSCRDLARHLNATRAGASDVDELERQRQRSKVSRWTDRETGMRHTHFELDPVSDAQLWAAIDGQRRRLRRKAGNGQLDWNRLQVDSALAAVCSSGDGEIGVQVQVLIDLDTLRDGLHEHSVCELADGTALPVATVRQMACRAELIPVVLDGNGRALDVGRGSRLATEAQRQAVRAMHTTCIHPDCDVAFDECRVHHVIPWEKGGKSELDNLVPLCESRKHHQLVHEGGWTLTITPDRIATFTRPDGTTYWSGNTIDRAPNGVRSRAAA